MRKDLWGFDLGNLVAHGCGRGKTREAPLLGVARFLTHKAFKTCISLILSKCIFQEGSPK